MHIQIVNQKAIKLLKELEELDLIKVLRRAPQQAKTKLSEKYKGIINQQQAESLNKHTQEMRSEW